jgi:hypothetical protein
MLTDHEARAHILLILSMMDNSTINHKDLAIALTNIEHKLTDWRRC